MKIQIIGYSGSGKTTLAEVLSKIYKIDNVLHLDSLQFNDNWELNEKNDFINKLTNFIKLDDWIIEGNYFSKVSQRFEICDLLIFLNYNRFFCLKSVFSRHKRLKNENYERFEIPGCKDKIDLEFINWVLFKGRNRNKRKKYKELIKNAKSALVFKNRNELLNYIEELNEKNNVENIW